MDAMFQYLQDLQMHIGHLKKARCFELIQMVPNAIGGISAGSSIGMRAAMAAFTFACLSNALLAVLVKGATEVLTHVTVKSRTKIGVVVFISLFIFNLILLNF